MSGCGIVILITVMTIGGLLILGPLGALIGLVEGACIVLTAKGKK